MNKIYILGMGPGNSSYVSPLVMETARTCDILLGGKRNLELVAGFPQEKIEIGGDIPSLLDFIRQRAETKKLGILVSGDPGLFSLLNAIRRSFPLENLEVIPGISSIQYLFAKLRLSWHDCVILSLHGKEEKDLAAIVRDNPKVAIFTDKKNTPAGICHLLLREGIRGKKVVIGENLSYPEEKIRISPLENLNNLQFSELNVLAVLQEELLKKRETSLF
ncbi:MAG: precorrin-6y C5,15-methyltransferase (decarboxylating) subunit CbiE [Dethiobacter sp.]|nr:MAG: precorrin-6y C5,15-methyltransferase (decarboxylating) subunit CbiE [Dethiobacter sp.]